MPGCNFGEPRRRRFAASDSPRVIGRPPVRMMPGTSGFIELDHELFWSPPSQRPDTTQECFIERCRFPSVDLISARRFARTTVATPGSARCVLRETRIVLRGE
jgi:hypothetical protein